MLKREVLYHNKWLSLMRVTYGGNKEYVYSHHPWCNSRGVAILGYRINDNGDYEFLARREFCPAHGVKNELVSLTGGADAPSEYPFDTACRELKEESGYVVRSHELIGLGMANSSKASDYKYYLYAVDLTGVEQGDITGDGSYYESLASVEWIGEKSVILSKDPVLISLYTKLMWALK